MTVAGMQLLVTPPGGSQVDLTAYMAWSGASQQFTITQNFGRQGDTAQIPLVEDWSALGSPAVLIETLSTVVVNDTNLSITVFAGVITNPQLFVTGANRNEWVLQCTDFTFYADKATVQGSFTNATVGAILCALTNGSGSGITAALTTAGGYVDPGPVLASYSMGYKPLSSAWKQLAQQAGGTIPYGWFVDENRHLHFNSAATAVNSGVTFTTSPASQGAEGHIALDGQFTYEWDATALTNQVVVQGASTTVQAALDPTPTDQWLADGTSTAWPLRFTPNGSMYMTVNGIGTPVASAAATSDVTTTGWLVQQNAAGAWFLNAPAGTPPSAGTVIAIWYNYTQPIVTSDDDVYSQATFTGPNGGVFSEYISDSSITTLAMAMARSEREKAEYAWPAERVTFNSTEDFTGWVRAGQVITCNLGLVPDDTGLWGVNAQFLVTQNMVTFGRGGLRSMQITAVRVSSSAYGGSATYVPLAPGTSRPYTFTDILANIVDQLGEQTDAETAVGQIGNLRETTTFVDSVTGTVVSGSQNWDQTVWGAFSWS